MLKIISTLIASQFIIFLYAQDTLLVTHSANGAIAVSSICPIVYDNFTNGTFSGAVAIPLDTDIKGLINPSGDKDYYKFTITNPGAITVSLTTLPADYDLPDTSAYRFPPSAGDTRRSSPQP